MSDTLDLSSVTDSRFLDDDTFEAPIIYGRMREQDLLLSTFQSLSQSENKRQRAILIHGSCGIGKTALVEHFRYLLCRNKQAHFCAGKYFQKPSVQEPYSAITAAFSDLCDLVSQADDFDEDRKLQIRRLLGREAGILKKFLSNFSPFLDPSEVHDLPARFSDQESLYEFKAACKAFLQAMSSWQQPVVVFLDDIQWMDAGSKHLIRMFLSDCELKNVLFIFAYNAEENDVVTKALAGVERNDFVDLPLDNMNSDEVVDFLAGIMNMPVTDELKHLGKLVQKRTGGNTFHVIQFIDAIEREKLLQFDKEAGLWVYDVENIQREMMVSDTLADKLLHGIQQLAQDEQEALQIAALLGYEFEATHVLKVYQMIKEDRQGIFISSNVSLSLSKAVDLGILEILQHGRSFHFSHVRLQAEFRSMLCDSMEQRLHHFIGEMYLTTSSHDSIYLAAIHLNLTVDLKFDPLFRRRLAYLNLMASQYCKERSAFDVAAALLREGLSLLDGEGKWCSTFDLAFSITEELARMELSLGNLNACKTLTNETLFRARSQEMKIKGLLIDVECQIAGNEITSVLTTAFNALRILGIHMPRKVSAIHVLLKLLRVRRKLSGKTDAHILQLPHMSNRSTVAATRILVDLGFYCAMKDKAALYGAFAGLCAAELTLLHGVSPYSATAMILYGSAELLVCRKFDCAYRVRGLALQMIDRVQCRDTERAAVSIWVTSLGYWVNPIGNLQAAIHETVESGFCSGDTFFTAVVIAHAFGMAIFHGGNLQELEEFMRNTYNRLVDVSKGALSLWAQPAFQFVLNHQRKDSNRSDLIVLSGEIMNEPEYFRMAVEANHPLLMVVAWTYKGVLALNYGYTNLAVEMFQKLEKIGVVFRASYESWTLSLYASLSYYEEYRRTECRMYLRNARRWRRKLEQALCGGNHNATCLTLLRAEELAARKSVSIKSARAAFDLAITATARHKYIHYEGMCNQLAALYMASREKYCAADQYFARSIALHEEWGAHNMVDWLHRKRSDVARLKAFSEEEKDIGRRFRD